MERGNSKHSPQQDEELAKEAESFTRGAPASPRVEGWREQELASDDDQPEPTWVPGGQRPEGAPNPLTAEQLAARSRLGQAIPRATLPADRAGLLAGAEQMQASAEVTTQLARLPADRTYHTVYEIWEALGYRNESPS